MSFITPYQFDGKCVVIIQSAVRNKSLRVLPKQQRRIDHNGGTGKFARWEALPQEDEEGTKVRFKSTKTGKYLRIIKKNDKYSVDVGGTGGKFTVFNIEMIENRQVLLESDVFPSVYLAVDNKGVKTGSGGKLCNLRVFQQEEGSTSEEEDDDEEDESVAGDEKEDEEYEMVTKDRSPEEEEDDDSIIIHNEEEEEKETAAENEDEERLLTNILNTRLLEGYCMVFERESEYFEMVVVDLLDVGHPKHDLENMEEMCSMTNVYGIKNDNDKTLQWIRKPDIADEEFADKAPKRCKGTNPQNILRGFNGAHIQYKIIWSRPSLHEEDAEDKINPNDDCESKYIYVVLWMDEKYAESYADYQDLSVLINREEAIKAGRSFDEFHLAHRTYLASVDADDKIAINEDNTRSNDDDNRYYPEVKMLPIECWNNIHIPFEASIKLDAKQHNIYELYPAANAPSYLTVITHRLYLRILYSCLVDDFAMKGANFQVDRYLADKTNPFVTIFALHEFDNEKFYPVHNPKVSRFAARLFLCDWKCGWISAETLAEIVDDIRQYYGEYIAFYYGFLSHYIGSLVPMVLIGLIWFIVQLGAGTVSVGGSTFYILICIIWSTITIETWYRKECALKFKWGMCRYRQTEVPRPTFSGAVKISYSNGDIIEDHKNLYAYYAKIAFSLSTMILCIAIVIVLVGTIWILKQKWRDDPGYKMAIGIINAIQIKVANALYTKLAYALNEFEQHRLVNDYYNHLVVKRIIFMVVNSFNSLFYMAFYDGSYVDNEDRLNSLRIQLFTLFFTSIVILNFLEVVIPQIPRWIRKYKANRKKKAELEENMERGIAHQHIPDTSAHVGGGATVIDIDAAEAEEELKDARFNGGCDRMIILDIEQQILAPKVPSNLDNVAEIVILQGYIIVFAVVLPIMPFLAFLNALLEIRIDVYNLCGAQRPFPFGADGLGVWRAVLSIFNTLAVFSNMAVVAWDTNLPEIVLRLGTTGKIIWYFLICLAILAVMVSVRLVLPNESLSTKQAIARQEQCENLVTLLQDSSKPKK